MTKPHCQSLNDTGAASAVLWLRMSQLAINDAYRAGRYRIPIHLALGHEALAVALSDVMTADDQLVLSHRNIHYNLARSRNLSAVHNEYLLQPGGLAGGCLGSMNLSATDHGIVYSSSILGNNFGVAAGLALGKQVTHQTGMVVVVTGDGAIEEGSFYETLVCLRSFGAPALVLVENNQWSLATRIEQRRCAIDLGSICAGLGVEFVSLSGNDVFEYIDAFSSLRRQVCQQQRVVCVEAHLSTLGEWIITDNDSPDGRLVNYHAGPAPTVRFSDWPVLAETTADPVYVLLEHFDRDVLKEHAVTLASAITASMD